MLIRISDGLKQKLHIDLFPFEVVARQCFFRVFSRGRPVGGLVGSTIRALRKTYSMMPCRRSSQKYELPYQTFSVISTQIISKHGELAPRLCNKDPYTALWLPTIRRLYPNSKFILMIRDARAVIHSMVERKVPVAGYNTSDETVCRISFL